MPEILLGLDIGSRSVRAALVRGGRNVKLLAAEAFPTPPDALAEGELSAVDGIADLLRGFINGAGVKPDGLAVCINSPNIITRRLTLPPMSAPEIQAAVKFEIHNMFPSIQDTHVIAHKVIADAAGAGASASPGVSMSVLAALCPAQLVKTYADLAARLGLPFARADIQANAQLKAMAKYGVTDDGEADADVDADKLTGDGSDKPADESVTPAATPDATPAATPSGSDKPAGDGTERPAGTGAGAATAGLLVDIGSRSSLVSVVSRGKLLLSRYVAVGASGFDDTLADRAGVHAEEVAAARRGGDFSQLPVDIDALKSVVDICFAEIGEQARQTIEFYDFDKPEESVAYVSVVGEGGMIPDIDNYFAVTQNLKPRPVRLTGECAAARYPKLMLGAVGCALRDDPRSRRGKPGRDVNDINFAFVDGGAAGGTGTGILGMRGPGRLVIALAAAAVIAAAGFGSAAWYASRIRLADAETADITAEMASASDVAEQETAISEAREKLAELSDVITAVEYESVKLNELLTDLAEQAPETLFAISLSALNANEVTLSGKSKDYDSISGYALLLRATGKFDSVRIDSITANEVVTDTLTDYSFTMTIAANL